MFKKYKLRSYNLRLVILVIVTSCYGIAVINSADSSFTIKQCLGMGLSLVLMLFISFVDYNWLLNFYWLFYFINVILLVLVKAIGVSVNGAQRWIRLGGFQLQPSELSKVIMIIFTAKVVSMYKKEINNLKFLAVLGIVLIIPLALIEMEPDLSTTILITLVLLTIIFCAGLSYKIIGIALLIVVPLATAGIIYVSNPNQTLLEDYQRNRIMAFIEPENYGDGTYQQDKAVQAIGSGQLTGKGLNNDDPSSLKNANYIAEAQTDFIFAVVGEELGFIGCCATILLLAWIVIECIIAAVKAKDFAGRLLCCGAAGYIAFQSCLNIGVVTRLLPNTGLPLPFFSYGLTSLLTLYITMGIVLNVSLQRNVEREDEIFADDFRG